MDPNDVSLIVCDVDGTVARAGQVVTPELRDIFDALAGRGIVATLATGRMLHNTVPIAEALGMSGYMICSEGGCVVSMDGTRYLHHPHMDLRTIRAVAERVNAVDAGVEVAVLSRDRIYLACEAAQAYVRPWGSHWESVTDWAEAPEPLLVLIFGPPEPVDDLADRLKQDLPEDIAVILETHAPAHHQIKVCSKEVDKGVGVRVLADHLGVGLGSVLCFGDWLNDLGLIRVAGYSIAPRNAVPQVLAAASKVSTYSFDEGFVARELVSIFGL